MKISATVILPEDVSIACERAKYPVVSCNEMTSATNKKLHLLLMQVPDTVDLNNYHELFDGLTGQKPLTDTDAQALVMHLSSSQPDPMVCPGVLPDTHSSSLDTFWSEPKTIGGESVGRLPTEVLIELPSALRVNND